MANPALIDELEKQFRDNPRRVFARLANEYRKAGDFMRAIEICHAHVPQQPGYISGHIVLGQALYDAGEHDQAQQTFQTALSLDPENLIALRQLGDIARNRRDYREARSWYTRLLEVDPQNDEIVAQLGEIALAEGDGGDFAAQEASEMQLATAVATEEEPAPEVSLDASTEVMDGLMHNDMGEPANDDSSETSIESLVESAREQEPDASDHAGGEIVFHEERSFESAGSATPAPEASAEPDDDVAWISSETETVEFTISDSDRADDTDFVVSEAGQDDERSFAHPEDDFGITFETEDFEEPPLRPHTGESLSIIAEEDALAGVQSIRSVDRSPFGEPIEPPPTASPNPEPIDPIDAAFEAMPDEDIDAAAELPRIDDLGGEGLMDEMTRWSSSDEELEDEPEPSPLAAESHEPLDTERNDALTSEIETIVEETITESVIYGASEPVSSMETGVSDTEWEMPDASPATEAFDYAEPVSSGEPEPEPELETQPVDSGSASDADAVSEEAGGDASSSAFVTETMAELYLQQGFRNEALEVYRKLAAQSPDDASIREKIHELENRLSAPVDRDEEERVPPMRRSAAAFFKSLASIDPPPPPPLAEPESETNPWDELLSDAGEVSEQDATAAAALSNGYHSPAEQQRGSAVRAAESKMSLHDIFGPVEQANRTSAGSLDAFFTPEGERVSGTPNDEEGREDLEAFNAWLEGLKK